MNEKAKHRELLALNLDFEELFKEMLGEVWICALNKRAVDGNGCASPEYPCRIVMAENE